MPMCSLTAQARATRAPNFLRRHVTYYQFFGNSGIKIAFLRRPSAFRLRRLVALSLSSICELL